MNDIPSAYSAAERVLPTIGEKSKVFKDFAAYAKTLDVEHDRQTVIGNLEVMRAKVGDLLGAIELAESQLKKAGELEEEMSELENKLGVPQSERWSGRTSENTYIYSSEDNDAVEVMDQSELEDLDKEDEIIEENGDLVNIIDTDSLVADTEARG